MEIFGHSLSTFKTNLIAVLKPKRVDQINKIKFDISIEDFFNILISLEIFKFLPERKILPCLFVAQTKFCCGHQFVVGIGPTVQSLCVKIFYLFLFCFVRWLIKIIFNQAAACVKKCGPCFRACVIFKTVRQGIILFPFFFIHKFNRK